MLPRRLRIARAAFLNTGKEMRVTSPHFSVSVREGASGMAAIVSKKVEKTAVGRHKLKRRMLDAAHPWIQQDKALYIYARAHAGDISFTQLNQELGTLLTNLLGPSRLR